MRCLLVLRRTKFLGPRIDAVQWLNRDDDVHDDNDGHRDALVYHVDVPNGVVSIFHFEDGQKRGSTVVYPNGGSITPEQLNYAGLQLLGDILGPGSAMFACS